jgi:hypothetical protein|nr:MAG TPA: hypothetical protein [Caudoviricetes sp.]
MIKYRLHNITDFGVEIHDFYTENSLNNYIAVFVDSPYWVENLETKEKTYIGYTGTNAKDITDEEKKHIENDILALKEALKTNFNENNVSRETFNETPTEWIARHIPTEEKEPYTKLEKISSCLGMLSVIIMLTFLLYIFLSSVSFIAEHFSEFTWKVFSIL